ncbi:MAG: diaminopimelate decarboxylase [Tannerella sp.]|uniref:diaminopimelate decarboxylase n=1 Tax=Tannerella sp. TaxID=2382127 RepID=UPI003FA1B094
MIKGVFPVKQFRQQDTPFYYYDMALLRKTLDALTAETEKYGYHQHYAVKANANPHILSAIAARGFGADCVSGGEIEAALACGFPASKIVFAGVGKADWEIRLGLEHDIACFNVESLAELRVIDELAAERKQTARVALRVNPDIDAHTHAKITTGLQENKFGINLSLLPGVFAGMRGMKHVRFTGLHFHIGSQITDMSAFRDVCIRSNDLQDELEAQGIAVGNVNFGGGLGIDYHHPNHLDVPDFESYFAVFHKLVRRRPGQQIHFELGRAVVGQCGSLISRVLYVKEGETKKFAVLDAGFTELLRPAFYDAYHRIENITSEGKTERYDVVGPVCESSDVFGKEVELNEVRRNDLIAFRSAGAYGEVMAMRYNGRPLPKAFFSDRLP